MTDDNLTRQDVKDIFSNVYDRHITDVRIDMNALIIEVSLDVHDVPDLPVETQDIRLEVNFYSGSLWLHERRDGETVEVWENKPY